MGSGKKNTHLWREIVGIILIGLAIFIICCLFSYYPEDPSFSVGYSRFPTRIHNWGGIIGAYISDGLFLVFGITAFAVPLAMLLGAKEILFPASISLSYIIRICLFVIFVLCLACFLSLYIQKLNVYNYHFDSGGILGNVLAKVSLKYLNIFGTYFVLLLTMLLIFMGLTRISYISLSQRFVQTSVKGGQKVNHVITDTIKKIDWPFARKAKEPDDEEDEQEEDDEFVTQPDTKFDRDEKISISRKKEQPVIRDDSIVIKERKTEKAQKELPLTFEPALSRSPGTIQLPPLHLLDSPKEKDSKISRESLKEDAQILIQKLEDFNIKGKVTEISPGPVITRFEFEPAPGIKINRIVGLTDDLALALKAMSIRIVAPIPGKSAVGIELANKKRETVFFKEIVSQNEFLNPESKLTIGFGKNIAGQPVINDLARMPHLLIAGSTGSGKSVLVNTIICSILYKALPDEVKFLMIDPKRLELSLYEGIPHLLHPVVTDPKKAAIALRWVVDEMERRYKKLAEKGVRDILRYNQKIAEEQEAPEGTKQKKAPAQDDALAEPDTRMPYIVVVIDELADLMMVSARDVEVHIARLAQMARAAGIHLIVATQRPSVDILTGTIKVNFPCRISFQVSSKVDSRTILDTIGAERLLGMGDMLFLPPGTSKLQRIHGSYLSEGEISRIVDFIKKQMAPSYDETILLAAAKGEELSDDDEDFDELYDQAVALVSETGQASISMLQRRLRVGYNRAARMIEKMEEQGVVGPSDGVKPRNVLINKL
jgi:S-DNA-T family DNA segregation ATPase FtsK/SpoIIIE